MRCCVVCPASRLCEGWTWPARSSGFGASFHALRPVANLMPIDGVGVLVAVPVSLKTQDGNTPGATGQSSTCRYGFDGDMLL